MNPSSPQRVTVEQLAEDFLERYRRGERPALSEYIERHPEHAEQICDLFPALVMMEQIAPDSASSAAFPSRPFAHEPPGGYSEQLGDFRILREVGRGGMGIVYEAEQVSLGRHVALKVLPPQLVSNAKMRQRFEREAKAAAKLHHTNIVPVFGVGIHDRTPYYAMQFIQGLGLDAVIEELERMRAGGQIPRPVSPPGRFGNLPPKDVSAVDVARSLLIGQFQSAAGALADPSLVEVAETSAPPADAPSRDPLADSLTLSSSAVLPGQSGTARQAQVKKLTYWQSVARVGVQVADALEYAHQQGIRHRDIKPSNLLLDTQGTVWVTDFGLAKTDDQQNLTHPGDVLGTLRYMPPEAFDGKSDARSDVYALGLTLYELLALTPAFDEKDRHQLVRQVMTGQPIRLGKRNPEVPRDLETIIHKAIDREPASRYQTAGDLAADLERFLRDEPIQARRISLAERLARWARHHQGVAAALAVIAVLLVAVAVVSSLAAVTFRKLATEANDARQKAEQAKDKERWERYRADIAAAASALQTHNGNFARHALEAAPEEHRNWEWQHFYSQLDNAHSILRGHESECWDVQFSPDGQRVVSCAADNTVRVWDTVTGQQVAVLRGPGAKFRAVRLSPDGTRVAAGTVDGIHCIWDVATGKSLAVLQGVAGTTALRWSPDSQILAYALSPDHAVQLWGATTGPGTALAGGHTGAIYNLSFSPDGRQLASCGQDQTICLWDMATGRLLTVLRGHTGTVLGLAFSPDGKRLASSASYPDHTARVWDLTTGEVTALLSGHRNAVFPVAFSPDGGQIATASLDQTARLWDGITGKPIATLEGHTGYVHNLAFDPTRRRLVTASQDNTLRLWDTATGQFLSVLHGHTGAVWGAAYSRDGALLASASHDGTVRLWNTELIERKGVLRGHAEFVYDVACSPDGKQAASAAWDGTVRLWDLTTGQQTALWQHETNIVNSVDWSRDGKHIVSASRDDHVHLWDAATGKRLHLLAVHTGYWAADTRAVLNPQGTLLAGGSRDGLVRLWDVNTGEVVADLHGHESCVTDVAFSPVGSQLASGDEHGTVRLWNVAAREPIAVLPGHTGVVHRIAWNDDGHLLATASADKSVRLWNAQTHELLRVLRPGSIVYGVTFSPDGSRLACGCGDNTIRLWDVASGTEVAELRGHQAYVHAVAFSPDGTRLISGSGDQTVRIWDTLPVQERARRP
jgi:WD40 repeat protein/serine/threonine protein kinase